MKTKLKKIILGLSVTFLIPTIAYCDEVDFDNVFYKVSNSNQSDAGYYQILKKTNADLPKIIINKNDGSYQIGYCIDVGANLPNSGDNDTISIYNQNLEQYLSSNNVKNAKEISKKINEYIYFGYSVKDKTSREQGEYYAATQQLIWETLSDAGYRTAEYNSIAPFHLKNGTQIDLTPEKNEILSKINNHYKTPSFCSSTEKLEIAVGETATYTDNNGVLPNYNVECSEGMRCEKDGNKLKVSIVSATGEQKITFTKSGAGDGTTLYKEGNNQAVVINQGKIEPVSCSFGVDAYKNVQTSGIKTLAIISIGLLFGLTAYLIYYKKVNLNH